MLQDNLPVTTITVDAQTSPRPEDTAFLVNHAAAIRRLGRNIIADAVEIGRRLIEVNKHLEHGKWLPWLKAEFAWGETTARRFMQLHALAVAKSSKLADLNLPLSGLYLLAEPGTPDEVRDEIIDLAKREPVKHKDVAALLKLKKNKGTAINGEPSSAVPVPRGEVVPLHPQVKEAAAHFSAWRDDRKAREAAVVEALATFVRLVIRDGRFTDDANFQQPLKVATAALRAGEAMGFVDCEELAS